MMQLVGRFLVALSVASLGTLALGASDTTVESTRAVESPDGSKSVVIDRFTPVLDGEAERFSGRMLLRVQSKDGSAARQRYIEASQVRVVQPPVWLDGSRLCAFVYNVAKNSNGIVYFEPEANRAVQVEFVMPRRQMAASGTMEQELTSLEVTEFAGAKTLKVRNVPWQGGSAFPLVLAPLPPFFGQPYDLQFYKQVNDALAAYKTFLKKHGMEHLEPEQASESFSPNDKWLGMLACDGAASWLLGVPLEAGVAADVLGRVKVAPVKGVNLSCSHHLASDSGEEMLDSRFLTAWKGADSLQVIKETYGAESEEPLVQPVAQLDVDSGTMTDLTTTGTATPNNASRSTVPETPLVLAPPAAP